MIRLVGPSVYISDSQGHHNVGNEPLTFHAAMRCSIMEISSFTSKL